jgi:hypothetical protein
MNEHFEQAEKYKLIMQDFTRRLNAEPDPREFDKTPDGKANTLPISFVEMTLDELFLGQWQTKNFHWSAITNEVQGSIELVVIHPVTGKELTRTGAGSIIITVDSLTDEQKDKMSKQDRNLYALNPENKKPNALDLGFPKLKAECLKNAAQSLGKIFGRDINRKKKDVFKPALKPLSDAAFQDALKRIQDGRLETLALAEANFILTAEQKEIMYGESEELRTKKLN